MKKRKALIFTAVILSALFIAAAIFFYTIFRFFAYTPAAYTESAAPLPNPYIGWYRMFGYVLSDTEPFDLATIESQEYGPELIMLEINLQNYQETPVSDTALHQLDHILTSWQSRGKQLIVRFLYDWDGNALEKEPKDISLILQHMSQTAKIVNQHTDCVYILQGIFVGAWAEMHSSNYMGEEDMLTLANHWNAVTDPSIFLAVRTPEQWRVITRSHDPLSASQNFDDSLPARLGLFNDGMLGSDTDLGTYGTLESLDPSQAYGKLTRQKEIEFQNVLCSYVPNGGETVIDNPYNDFSSAIADFAATHISYLNHGYDQNVHHKWSESLYTGTAPFDGMNGYDYITRHLGYRYVLRSSDFSLAYPWRDTAWLSVTLENVGFSNSYRSFDVSLLLRHMENGKEYSLPIQTDTRFWDSGAKTSIAIPLKIRTYDPGAYELFLKISDPVSGYDIRLANESPQTADGLSLGILEIRKFPNLEFLSGALIGK